MISKTNCHWIQMHLTRCSPTTSTWTMRRTSQVLATQTSTTSKVSTKWAMRDLTKKAWTSLIYSLPPGTSNHSTLCRVIQCPMVKTSPYKELTARTKMLSLRSNQRLVLPMTLRWADTYSTPLVWQVLSVWYGASPRLSSIVKMEPKMIREGRIKNDGDRGDWFGEQILY